MDCTEDQRSHLQTKGTIMKILYFLEIYLYFFSLYNNHYRRTRGINDYQLVYWTFLGLRLLKPTVLNNCASTSVMKIFSNSLYTTSSSWNRQSMTRKALNGSTFSLKITRRFLTFLLQNHSISLLLLMKRASFQR